jgi:hypothetical protein
MFLPKAFYHSIVVPHVASPRSRRQDGQQNETVKLEGGPWLTPVARKR